MSERPAPPTRLPLAGGVWVRHRRVPGVADKVLVTGPTGRFLLLPAPDLDALSSDPASPHRRRLADLGFLHGPSVAAAPPRGAVWRHVVHVNGPGGAMREATARSVVDRILESPSPSLRVEIRGADPLADPPLLRLLVGLLRARSRDAGKPLSLALAAPVAGAADEIIDFLIDAGVAIAVLYDGPPAGPHALHDRYAARGMGPEDAFVTVAVPLDQATLAAGPGALVDACARHGIAYLLVRPLPPAVAGCATAAQLAFHRDLMRRILEANLAGAFLVDLRLALHLEALVEAAKAPAPVPAAAGCLAYGPDGRAVPALPGPDGACGGCVYDPYCGGDLLEPYLMNDALEGKAWGNGYCERSMGTFDAVFELLASPQGPALRRVFQRWMAAHERVAKRLAAAL